MKFFSNDITTFPIPTSLITKIGMAHKSYKRKIDDEKALNDSKEKKQRVDEESAIQQRIARETAETFTKEIETVIAEAGSVDKDLACEQKTLENFLNCMGSCKDEKRMQTLIQQSKLSRETIGDLQQDYKKIQAKILELRVKKLSKKWITRALVEFITWKLK